MLPSFALYSHELTDEERELGFELVEVSDLESGDRSRQIPAVAFRMSDSDRIVKMQVRIIGGVSYRQERLRHIDTGVSVWLPVGAIVFPTAEQALDSVCCRN
jgi:hypothetical protein